MKSKPTIGIIGAGKLGTALAQRFIESGYTVSMANSKGPESLSFILDILLPDVHARTIPMLAVESDVIIFAIPLHKYTSLDPALFAQKIIIDAMNYWPPTEGQIEAFDRGISSSEVLQHYFSQSKLVKSMNHIAYNELNEHNLSHNVNTRRVIFLASDDANARKTVSELVNAIGFDAVPTGNLDSGRLFQPDTPLFNARLTKKEAEILLG